MLRRPGYWAVIHPLGSTRVADIEGDANALPSDHAVFAALDGYFTANPSNLERELFGLVPGAPVARAIGDQSGLRPIEDSFAPDRDFAEAIRADRILSLAEWGRHCSRSLLPFQGDWDLLVQLILEDPTTGLAITDAGWWIAQTTGPSHLDVSRWWSPVIQARRAALEEACGINFNYVT